MHRRNEKFRITLERRLFDLTREYCQLLGDLRGSNLPCENDVSPAFQDLARAKLKTIAYLIDDLAEYDEIMKCNTGMNIDMRVEHPDMTDISLNAGNALARRYAFPILVKGGERREA